jgi:hypothetical protein
LATDVQRKWLIDEVLKDGSDYYAPPTVMRACVLMADKVLLEFGDDGALEWVGVVFDGEEFWYLGEEDGWDYCPPFDELAMRLLAKTGADGAAQRAFIYRCQEILQECDARDSIGDGYLEQHVAEHADAALDGEAGRTLTAKFGQLDAEAAAMREALQHIQRLLGEKEFTSANMEEAVAYSRALRACEADAGRRLLDEVIELRKKVAAQ